MRYAKLITAAAVAAAVSVSACNRPETTDEAVPRDTMAEDRQQQQEDVADLERRAAELDREWNEMQSRLAGEATDATAALRAEVREDVTNVREAVAELRTTTQENWWQRHERVVERNLQDLEEDVKRFARQWTAPVEGAEVGTSGAAENTWEARRDRLVSRVDAHIEAMEEALRDVDVRGAEETEVEDTRARVRKLRDDNDRLRNASERDWWEITKQRVEDYIERVEQSIERLDDDRA